VVHPPDAVHLWNARGGCTSGVKVPICPDKKLDRAYDHPGTRARLAALDQVVRETGATANQVVLAWLIGGELPVVPLVGASSVAQLEESLAAVDLELSAEQRQLLDAAN
jgi:aryl-alcohol dehydrogenase-like predicted oxidoreductase